MSDAPRLPEPGDRFDWSRFHPNMHPIFSKECWRWYGGPVRHALNVWEYAPERFRFGWLIDPMHIWKHVTGCWWGRHDRGEIWFERKVIGHHCHWCPFEEYDADT